MTRSEIACELLVIAKDDLASLEGLAKLGIGQRVCCFLAQQAVEKCLKAVIAHHHRDFPHTHNLVTLSTIIKDLGLDVPLNDANLDLLNPFAVLVRYGIYEDEYPDSAELLIITRSTLVWCEEQLTS
jgi:HEPN domain-containing protein